jgi:hypothetical protein
MSNLWYVDSAAAGTNAGTSWTNAWTSFASIVWGGGGVIAGDTLYISGGTTSKTYSEKWTIGASGTVGNPIYIRVGQDAGHTGAGSGGVIFDYNSGDNGTGTGISCPTNYIVFDGSVGGVIRWHFINLWNTTTGDTPAVFGASSGGGTCIGNVFRYLDIQNCNNGFELRYQGRTTVEYCTISVRGDAAITLLSSADTGYDWMFVRYNDITLNFNSTQGPGIYPYSGPDGIQGGAGLTIHNNVIRVTQVAYITSMQHPDSVQVAGGFTKIYNNEFINVGDSCIDIAYAYANPVYQDIQIFNNVFRMETQIDIYPQYIRMYVNPGPLTDISRVQIENNTFVDCTQAGGQPVTISGLGNPGSTGGNTLRNNLFINCGVNNSHFVWIIESSSGTGFNSSWTISNNAYYLPVSSNIYIAYLGVAYLGSTWVTSTGVETGGKIGLPVFTSYTAFAPGNNFHLQPQDTVALGSGATLSLATIDKDGVTRTIPWDIGAYKYISQVFKRLSSHLKLKGLAPL